MTESKPKKEVTEAKIVDVDVDSNVTPLPAEIVSDRRNFFGQRLGLFAFIILLLFFAISGYVSSAHNGNLLDKAANNQTKLVNSIDRLTDTQYNQTQLIKQLQNALRKQNRILEKAGLAVVVIPGDSQNPSTPTPGPSSNPSNNGHHSHKGHGSRPRPHPSGKPSPTPLQYVQNKICTLTGICSITYQGSVNAAAYHEQQSLQRPQVYRFGLAASTWNVIFHVLADLGLD